MIIGISGKLRSGKDTVARLLLSALGDTVCKQMSLADALKVECQEIYGLDCHRMYTDYDYKEEIRHILIKHGADRRTEDINYWVKKVLAEITKPITLVPDIRYANEMETIAKGTDEVIFIRVEASDEKRKSNGWNESAADSDPSECQLDDYNGWNLVIQNNGTLKDLRTALSPAIKAAQNYLKENSLLHLMAEIS